MPVQTPEKTVSWEELHRDARTLASRLIGAGPFAAIVAVTRGGLVPAAILARELDLRVVETVCVASYDHMSQGALHLIKRPADDIIALCEGGQRALIVDDLVDTGRTAKIVRGLMPKGHYATLYAKPMGRPLVDTFVTEVPQDTWIHFPWDTSLAFQPPMRGKVGGQRRPRRSELSKGVRSAVPTPCGLHRRASRKARRRGHGGTSAVRKLARRGRLCPPYEHVARCCMFKA
jgi:xanthine phosphoribosyltransferase